MADFDIATSTFGERGFLSRRRLRIDNKQLDTPAKVIPAVKKRNMESLSPDSRKAAELYAHVNSGLLKEARHDADTSIAQRLDADTVEDDEMVFAFTSFQDAHSISPVEARQLADATAATSEFITTPLQPTLSRTVEPAKGLNDSAYQSFRAGAENILQEAAHNHPDTPVMGVLPMLGQAYIEDLLDLYVGDYSVRAFCLNFDRKKITASRQISLMQPLARYITNRGLEEEVLIYAINMNPKDRATMAGVFPAANFASVGLGVDVVGENHIPPRLPKAVREKLEESDSGEAETEFHFFDKDAVTFRDIPLGELSTHWPDDTALGLERVLERAQASDQERGRMETLFNAEQMALAMSELQHSLDDGTVREYLETREGITEDVIDAFDSVRDSFDAGRDQSGLHEFS